MYLKTKKMTDISQTQAGFKAESRRNPLWIPRRFNAKSRCVCRNRLNFRLFRYTLVLSETSKSSSVSVNAAGFCACERSAIFVALRCTSGAGANRNRQGGTGNQGRGRGTKSEWHICSKPAPRCKGRTASRWRACNPPHTPAAANRLQGRGVPIAPQKTGTVRRKPAIPPTRRPPSRQAPPQTGACETNNCAKNREMQQKRRILPQSCALCAQRIINTRLKYIKMTAAKRKSGVNYTKALNTLYNWRKAQSVKVLKNRNLRGLYCLSGVKVLY